MPQPNFTPAELRWRTFLDGRRCLVPIMTLGYLRLIEDGYATYRKEGHCLEVWATPLAHEVMKRASLFSEVSDPWAIELRDEIRLCFHDAEHERLRANWEAVLRDYYDS